MKDSMPSCANCGHSYAQHTKGINYPQKYCRHCPCLAWTAPPVAEKTELDQAVSAPVGEAKVGGTLGLDGDTKREELVCRKHDVYYDPENKRCVICELRAALPASSALGSGQELREALEAQWENYRTSSWPDRREEWSAHWKGTAIDFAVFVRAALALPLAPKAATCSCGDSSNEHGCPIHGEFNASNIAAPKVPAFDALAWLRAEYPDWVSDVKEYELELIERAYRSGQKEKGNA